MTETKRNKVLHKFDGKEKEIEYFDEEEAISQLLHDGVLFANSFPFVYKINKEGDQRWEGPTITLFVNANDVFCWACAEGQDIKCGEVRALYEAHIANEKWGSVMWCAKKRGLKPQWLMAKDMIEQGAWDEEMEALSEENAYMWDCEDALNRKDKWVK